MLTLGVGYTVTVTWALSEQAAPPLAVALYTWLPDAGAAILSVVEVAPAMGEPFKNHCIDQEPLVVAVSVMDVPAQIGDTGAISITGCALMAKVVLALAVQPLPSVTVTA